jgi:hypothetical protein
MTRAEMQAAITGQVHAAMTAARRAKPPADPASYVSVILAYADAHAAAEAKAAAAQPDGDALARLVAAETAVRHG